MTANYMNHPIGELRDQAVAWLEANGIDTSKVPEHPAMSYADGKLTTLYKLESSTGKDMLDPQDNEQIAKVTRTFDITIPPTGDVAEWLLPKCEACGR